MATRVWFIPGFMGSTLGLYTGQTYGAVLGRKIRDVWGTVSSITSGFSASIQALEGPLAAGQRIEADGIVDSTFGGYSNFLQWLQFSLGRNVEVRAWPFDWRLSVRETGRSLANDLAFAHSQGVQNLVLAHSQGALVAWAAYAALVDDHATEAMQKFTTFGGALYGTSSTPLAFLGGDSGLVMLSGVLQLFNPGGPAPITARGRAAYAEQTTRRLLNLIRRWRGLYDLYPDYSNLDDPGDVNRPILFLDHWWTAAVVPPDFQLMAEEVVNVHQWLRQAKYLPPYEVVNHIIGQNLRTPYRVQAPMFPASLSGVASRLAASIYATPEQRRAAQLPSFSRAMIGDLRASVAQQMFPGRYFQTVVAEHSAMQDDLAVRLLAQQLLLTGNPPIPTPDPLTPIHAPAWTNPLVPPQQPFLFNSDPIRRDPPKEKIIQPAPVIFGPPLFKK